MRRMVPAPVRASKRLRLYFIVFLVMPCIASITFAQDRVPADLHILPVQGRVYMISGAGGNVTVQVGDEAVIVVDPGVAAMGEKVLEAIRSLSSKPIEFIIDTTIDEDHSGANGAIAKVGPKDLSGRANDLTIANAGQSHEGASIVAYIGVLNRMADSSGKKDAVPPANYPSDPYDSSNWKLFNDEPIILYHVAAAHTDSDTIVFFRRSDVVSAGELFVPYRFPVIDEEKGGSIDGIIDALTTLIDDILVPRENEEGGTYVIPGRGRICDRTEVVNYRDMLTIIRARIADLVKKGKTLQEVKDAKPTFGYDGLYGAQSGPWTTNMFIEAIYRDLTKDKKHK